MRQVTRWSVQVVDATSGDVLFAQHPDRALRTASIGKLLLLDHLSAGITSGVVDPHELLTRTADDRVADSGLWQYLATDSLPVADLCALVGAASDNLAANVLLRRYGLDAVAATAARNGLTRTALHDRVRDVRGPADPPTLSTFSTTWAMSSSVASGVMTTTMVVPVSRCSLAAGRPVVPRAGGGTANAPRSSQGRGVERRDFGVTSEAGCSGTPGRWRIDSSRSASRKRP